MSSSKVIADNPIKTMISMKDIALLFKSRLSLLVVFSAVLGYLLGAETIIWSQLLILSIGGFFLTGASNGFNQIWEKDLDILMDRTKNRPIPTKRMSVKTAFIISSVSAIIGVSSLWIFINTTVGVLALLAIVSYVLLYTPLKQKSVIAVFVGAFPGAIPPLLGYVAATGSFGLDAGLLFLLQFVWQFPHFWSIAWVAHDDYQKAGFSLLPDVKGKTKKSALITLISTVLLIPAGMLLWKLPLNQPIIGDYAMIITVIAGIVVSWFAYKLYLKCDIKSAKALMFSTFLYLPVVQIIYVIDKL